MIEAGEPAPDFTLANHKGEQVSLADLRGRKTMLVFYPGDFSPTCTDQLSIYQEVVADITERDAGLIGISVDSSPCHAAFRAKTGISFPLLADFHPKGEVCRAYGALIEECGHSNRSLVLVGDDGTVLWSHVPPTPLEIPGANLIFDALDSAT